MFGENEYDPTRQFGSIPIEEQLDALGRAVDAGKVSFITLVSLLVDKLFSLMLYYQCFKNMDCSCE